MKVRRKYGKYGAKDGSSGWSVLEREEKNISLPAYAGLESPR